MALANVTLTNTFDDWRTRTNQILVQGEQTFGVANGAFNKVNVVNVYATSIALSTNSYALATATSIGTSGNNYAIAIGAAGNSRAVAIGTSGNTYALATATSIGTSGNSYALATATSIGTSGNNYAIAIGAAGNSRAVAIGTSGNTYALATATSIGASGNSYTNAVGQAGNSFASVATNLTSGIIPVARVSGNYNLITGLGTIASGTWQGSTVGVAYGGTGQTTIGGIQSALGLGSLAYLSSVGTANLQDNSVNGAKIALGSDATGDLMYFTGTDWARLPAGTTGQVLRTNGTSGAPAWENKITTLETKTTSGLNTYDFAGIPSWARRVTLIIRDVETSSSVPELLVQLGTLSGGIQTSGYSSYTQFINDAASVAETTNATGFVAYMSTNVFGYKGTMTLSSISGNDWMQTHMLSKTGSAIHGTGYVSLTNPLYYIRITLSSLSTYTFSGGTITALYE